MKTPYGIIGFIPENLFQTLGVHTVATYLYLYSFKQIYVMSMFVDQLLS